MSNIIEITDFNAPELDVYARISEIQLLNRAEPEKGIFIAESPKDVGVRVKKLENEMREFDGIVYERVKRGTSGALHYFCKENMQVQNEVQLDLSKQVA